MQRVQRVRHSGASVGHRSEHLADITWDANVRASAEAECRKRIPLTATRSLGGPSPRRSEVGYSAPGLVPGQEYAVENVRVSTRFRFTQLSRAVKRRAAAHHDRVGESFRLCLSHQFGPIA